MENIDKNIPIPTRVKRRPGESVKLIASMDIGDSVFFKDQNTWVVYNRYFNVAKRQGRHIMVRAVDGGTRMWRDE